MRGVGGRVLEKGEGGVRWSGEEHYWDVKCFSFFFLLFEWKSELMELGMKLRLRIPWGSRPCRKRRF